MMKQSSILKWAQNGNKSNNTVKQTTSKNNWIHPPDALQRGHVAYLVKFLGNTEVDQPKGIDVVKDGIRKLKFSQQIKRSEKGLLGSKTPKVELTISIDGVAIQDPKTKKIFHQFPLHRISYCADDKTDKKFFSFIAKESDTEKHCCFVFVSDKLAEEITLTIGQAFDLAYRKFLETSGRDLEMKKQLMILQKRVRELEQENSDLRSRLSEYEENPSKSKSLSCQQNASTPEAALTNGTNASSTHKATTVAAAASPLPSLQPPPSALPRTLNRSFSANQSVNLLDIDISQTQSPLSRRIENNSLEIVEEDFNPRAYDQKPANGTLNSNHGNGHLFNGSAKDVFGCEPFAADGKDPFGMGNFGAQELENAIGAIDKKLAEMRDGFRRGLSFGNDEFSIESMDPLNQRT